jgi:membrane associated rhomboid family serine protease
MHVEGPGGRVPLRPLWRAFLLSFLTGSVYQVVWLATSARDLGRLGADVGPRRFLWPLCVAAGEIGALVIGASRATDTPDLVVAACAAGVLAATWALYDVAVAIGAVQARVLDSGAPRVGPAAALALLFVGFAIAILGVHPTGTASVMSRIIPALASGLVLPFWLLYLQHQLNRALLAMDPQLPEQADFGALVGDFGTHLTAVQQARLHAHRRASQMSEQLDIVPRAVLGLVALCTAVWAWQMLRFGFHMSLTEMRHAGASSADLVRDGQPWRLVAQNFVHFSVDHWAFNMLVTCLAGWMVERQLGHRRTLFVLVGSMVGCSALAWFATPVLYGPLSDATLAGGESGIAFGLIGALVGLDRDARGPIGRFGRWMAVIGLINSLAPGVGILAHAGGFAGGMLSTMFLTRNDVAPALPVEVVEVVEMVEAAAPILALPSVVPPPPIAPAPIAAPLDRTA